MTFSDLEVSVGRTSRAFGYVRENLHRLWIPGGGNTQQGFCRELAGAMFLEADEFFDRALALFLLRVKLRRLQASTWATVATYYSNYFSATSFTRLHMHAVTHLVGGAAFDVAPLDGTTLVFEVSSRTRRLSHEEIWRKYYSLATEMAWPSRDVASMLAPITGPLRFREQKLREAVNYRVGEGFREIYLSRSRYARELQGLLRVDRTSPIEGLGENAYNDRLAAERLVHVGGLLNRLRRVRNDPEIEEERWERRRVLIDRYADGTPERRFAAEIIE